MTRAEFEKKSSMTNSAWLKKIASQGTNGTYYGAYKFYRILKGADTEPSLW